MEIGDEVSEFFLQISLSSNRSFSPEISGKHVQMYNENSSSGLLHFSSPRKKKMKKCFLSKTGKESRQEFRSVPFCFNEYNNLKFEFLKRVSRGMASPLFGSFDIR